ncbi:MAG: DUF4115 domain-containing protein, partial [Rhodobacteraceae bacterium]|nr:DUF4115 domain-containing protein [Paracoccaceae bacterium]
MQRSKQPLADDTQAHALRGFDDYELCLGDVMRGERATLGKSLLEVQRDLRVRASYLAAIENGDLSAFESKGFVAGYVKSYARYLGLDPVWAYEQFCIDTGFKGVHEMVRHEEHRRAAQAETAAREARSLSEGDQRILNPRAPFTPARGGWAEGVDRGALASVAVLAVLIGAILVGGMNVLREIQRVDLAVAEDDRPIITEIDPVAQAARDSQGTQRDPVALAATEAPGLRRPQQLETPVLVARDGPIATIDPDRVGTLAPVTEPPRSLVARSEAEAPAVQVTETPPDAVALFAVRPAWIRVSLEDGTVLFERILDAGEIYRVPETDQPVLLRAGNSGSLFMNVGGTTFGPVGPGTAVASNVRLGPEAIRQA